MGQHLPKPTCLGFKKRHVHKIQMIWPGCISKAEHDLYSTKTNKKHDVSTMVLVCFECFESLHMGLQGFTLQTTEGGANNIHTSKKKQKIRPQCLKACQNQERRTSTLIVEFSAYELNHLIKPSFGFRSTLCKNFTIAT